MRKHICNILDIPNEIMIYFIFSLLDISDQISLSSTNTIFRHTCIITHFHSLSRENMRKMSAHKLNMISSFNVKSLTLHCDTYIPIHPFLDTLRDIYIYNNNNYYNLIEKCTNLKTLHMYGYDNEEDIILPRTLANLRVNCFEQYHQFRNISDTMNNIVLGSYITTLCIEYASIDLDTISRIKSVRDLTLNNVQIDDFVSNYRIDLCHINRLVLKEIMVDYVIEITLNPTICKLIITSEMPNLYNLIVEGDDVNYNNLSIDIKAPYVEDPSRSGLAIIIVSSSIDNFIYKL